MIVEFVASVAGVVLLLMFVALVALDASVTHLTEDRDFYKEIASRRGQELEYIKKTLASLLDRKENEDV